MRLLVCGSRDFFDEQFLCETLDFFASKNSVDVVIHGAAPGADSLAGEWAEALGIHVEKFPADWNKYGRAAGPIRNKQMLREGKPDAVIAFISKPLESSRGTANMVKISKEAGIQVYVEGRSPGGNR